MGLRNVKKDKILIENRCLGNTLYFKENLVMGLVIIIFIFGLLIGSFLNVCIYRIPREESIAYPPSHCTSCSRRIKIYDLMPAVSYILLNGKCRYCKKGISIKYPLVELSTGIAFMLIYYKYNISIEFFKFIILASFLIVIGIIDYNTTNVYLSTTLGGTIIGLAFLLLNYYLNIPIKTYILGMIIGVSFIALIILTVGGMGWGDAEICALCGIFLGARLTILMLFLSVIIGAIIGVMLIILKKKSRKDYITFGPSIAIATLLCILSGESMIRWYLNIVMGIGR